MKIKITLAIAFLSLLAACSGGKNQGENSAKTEVNAEAMRLLQGIWLDQDEDIPSFWAKGDSLFYPDTTSMPARFSVIGDTLVIEGEGEDNVRYPIVKQTEHIFEFQNKSGEERLSYISDEERVKSLLQIEGIAGKMELRDKWKFYQKAKPFFKREVFHLTSQTELSDFSSFVMNIRYVFCKPNTGAMGEGIHSYEVNDEDGAKTIFHSLLSECDDWVVEERIVQSEPMRECTAKTPCLFVFTLIKWFPA